MSDILIRGMEMPVSCGTCPIRHMVFHVGDECYLGAKITEYQRRPEDCPLIPVPDHGRLIDGNALYEKFVRLESEAVAALQTTNIGSVDGIKWSAILTERTGYKFDIADAPTIIPAKEGRQ